MIYTITFVDKKTKLGWTHRIDTKYRTISKHTKKCLAQSGWDNVKVSKIQEDK